jgi:hypothetical protein
LTGSYNRSAHKNYQKLTCHGGRKQSSIEIQMPISKNLFIIQKNTTFNKILNLEIEAHQLFREAKL